MVCKKNVIQDCFKFCFVKSDFGSHLASVCCRFGSIMVSTKCNLLINHIVCGLPVTVTTGLRARRQLLSVRNFE
jgi:hypothetical protein